MSEIPLQVAVRRLRTAKGNRALLVGAGGTAKAAIYALSKVNKTKPETRNQKLEIRNPRPRN